MKNDKLSKILSKPRFPNRTPLTPQVSGGVFDKIFDNGGMVFNVKHPRFGAVGDGVNDDDGAIQSALSAALDVGGILFFPPGTYDFSTTIDIITPNPIVILGSGFRGGTAGGAAQAGGTLLNYTGTGTAIRLRETGVTFADFSLECPNATSSTIGLLIDNDGGTTAVENWALRDVAIIGDRAGGAVAGSLGIKCNFGLKGVLRDVVIERWGEGVQLIAESNANHFDGCKIRDNITGLLSSGQGGDTIFITGSTIEGNETGINLQGGNILSVSQTHFENNVGLTPTNITVSSSRICSAFNFFGAADPNKDIEVTAGSAIHSSFFDILNAGITNNGTGVFHVFAAPISVSKTGSGPIIEWNNTGIRGTNATGISTIWDGFAFEQIEQLHAIKAGVGTTTVPHGAVGGAILALEGQNAHINGPHIQITTAADDHPLLQILNWSHDNIGLSFDAYSDGANWLSSDVGSNFQIQKIADQLRVRVESGIAQGSTITWDEVFSIATSAMLSMTGDLRLPVRTDANRGAAGTAGRVIFNSDDGNLNIDDGTNWILPDGTTT